jgi:hypothetical protein
MRRDSQYKDVQDETLVSCVPDLQRWVDGMEMIPEVDISRTCSTSSHMLRIWQNKLCIYVDWFVLERVAVATANTQWGQ